MKHIDDGVTNICNILINKGDKMLQNENISAKQHIPIEDVIAAFKGKNTGIYLSLDNIHNISGYTMDPFPEAEKNRNHWDSRGEGSVIKYLIMHYTVSNLCRTMELFTENKPDNRVSAHYVISQKEQEVSGGIPIRVVPDSERAWHAGVSFWGGKKNLNATSIGIEHVNQGFVDEEGIRKWFPFDENQIRISGIMSQDIVKEYGILPTHVLGHADIAPGRKQDPGILFPWGEIYYDYGVGAWLNEDEKKPEVIVEKYDPKIPCPTEVDLSLFLQLLGKYGYEIPSDVNIAKINVNQSESDFLKVTPLLEAFKAHFSANGQPERYDSQITNEDMFWAWAITAKYSDDLVGENYPLTGEEFM